MEIWNVKAIEKSEKILHEIKKCGDFVLIGGWAVYLWTKAIKSIDVDIYTNFDDFYKLQANLSKKGCYIQFNPTLKKFSTKIEEIDIDIYTPSQCNLIIPCRDVFKNKWFEVIENFKVIRAEPLLLLKLAATKKRGMTLKGFKDRVDVLALLNLDLDIKWLNQLFTKYAPKLKEELVKVVKISSKEYEYTTKKKLNFKQIADVRKKLLKKIK